MITLLNGLELRLIWMPAWLASDFHCWMISPADAELLAYSMLMLSLVPAATPSPHWLLPLPALVQVITPPCSVQPWLVSSDFALPTLNGYAPWPLLDFCTSATYWLSGWLGTGPVPGTA